MSDGRTISLHGRPPNRASGTPHATRAFDGAAPSLRSAAHGAGISNANPAVIQADRRTDDAAVRRPCLAKPRSFVGRHGVATVTAIALLALVAVALTTLGARITADVLRTRNAAADAQLRQLLLAGAADAASRSVSWGEQAAPVREWALDLPASLAADGAAVRATVAPAPPAATPTSRPADVGADQTPLMIHIDAEYGGRRAGQTLRLERHGGAWRLAEAIADGPSANR